MLACAHSFIYYKRPWYFGLNRNLLIFYIDWRTSHVHDFFLLFSVFFYGFFLISTAPTVQRYLWFNFVNIWWLITDKLCLIHKKSSFCFSLIQFCLKWCAIMSIWMWSFLKSRGFLIKIGFHVKSFDSESFWSNYLVPFRLNYRNSVRSFAVTNDRLRNLYICTLVS